MSEKEELARLAKRKKQIENKYAKLAKRRLNKINKAVDSKVDLLDLSDDDFDKYVNDNLTKSTKRLTKLSAIIFNNNGIDLGKISDAEFNKQLQNIQNVFAYYLQVTNQNRQQQNNQNNNPNRG